MQYFFRHRRGIAAQLIAVTLFTLAMLSLLSLVSLWLSQRIKSSAARVQEQAISGVVEAADMTSLLAQHRRMVEAALKERDPKEVEKCRRAADDAAQRLSAAASRNVGTPLLQAVSRLLPTLAAAAMPVFENFAGSAPKGTVAGIGDYLSIADRLQSRIDSYREWNIRAAQQEMRSLETGVSQLFAAALIAAVLTLFLIAPAAVSSVRRITRRLSHIAEMMRRLSQNDTGIPVRYASEQGEIGEMARAVAVFKSNAIALSDKHAEVARLNQWFDIALNNMARGLSMFDAQSNLIVCNSTYRELYQIPEAWTNSGAAFADIIRKWARRYASEAGESPATIGDWLDNHAAALARGVEFTSTHTVAGGRVIAIHCRPLADGGWVDVHEDITEKQRVTERICELARKDTLTGLANRHSFQEELAACFAEGGGQVPFAIIWIDLDRFKEVNDTYGHPVGDGLLQHVANRVRRSVRKDDFIARLGGDEFAIILRSEEITRESLSAIAARLNKTIREPCNILGHKVSCGASIGISCAPHDARSPDEIMLSADIALYHAKAAGRGQASFYDMRMAEAIQSKRHLQEDLEAAVRNNEFELHYQPILDLASGKVVAAEALMRWKHRVRGYISPVEFIPLAESTGLMGQLGAWALRTACNTAATWPQDISVSVNLSAAQFGTSNIRELVSAALVESGLVAERLQLEVTETLLLEDKAETWSTLSAMKELGVSVALDDFGTGYSSLSYLRVFAFNKIKIDQSFIRTLDAHGGNRTIVRAIVDLARTLGMKVVAEGVESVEQQEFLATLKCDEVQGYLYSRPARANDLVRVIAQLSRAQDAA